MLDQLSHIFKHTFLNGWYCHYTLSNKLGSANYNFFRENLWKYQIIIMNFYTSIQPMTLRNLFKFFKNMKLN